MPAEVLIKELGDRRVPVAVLAVVLSGLTVAALGIGAGMSDSLDELTQSMPAGLEAFIPTAPGGYVVGELFNLIAPLALVVYAVLAGAAATAGEEDAGTMAVLASLPVSRRSLLAQKAGALLALLVAVIMVLCVVTAVASAVFGTGLGAVDLAGTGVHLLLLAVFYGAAGLAFGAATGDPTLSAGAAGGLAVVSYLANAMLPLAGFDGWVRLSPWHYYAGNEPLANGADPLHLLVLLILIALALVLAFAAFEQRDLEG